MPAWLMFLWANKLPLLGVALFALAAIKERAAFTGVLGRIAGTFRNSLVAPVPVVAIDADDAADLAAFKRLKARFVRLKCKEGLAALEVCGKEFLTDHSGEAA